MIERDNFDQAVIMNSDGDLNSLMQYLYANTKLEMVLRADIKTCSKLLKKEAKGKINYMEDLKEKIG